MRSNVMNPNSKDFKANIDNRSNQMNPNKAKDTQPHPMNPKFINVEGNQDDYVEKNLGSKSGSINDNQKNLDSQ